MASTRPEQPPEARQVALHLLSAVLRRGRTLDEAFDSAPDLASVERRDRAFAFNIAATALRRLGQIDALIDHCLVRPLPRAAMGARDVLRLGVAQLVFLATPAHAAVDRTVALTDGRALRPYRGLINAVLRRLAREGRGLAEAHDAARLNTPDWMWQSWSAAFGDDICRRIADTHLVEPPLDITVKDAADQDNMSDWARRLDAKILPTGGLRRAPGGAVSDLAGYAAGGWWVQDAGAALPARMVIGGLGGDVADKTVADLCAAPGGKTAQLAAAGARVTAVDRGMRRLERLRENLARLGLDATTVAADVENWRPDESFDAVLLDAPCTGTGTIRRHPDIARLKSPADVTRLAAFQDRLLAAAARLVRPGGILVYSVCSLQTEEGPGRIAALLASGAPFTRAPVGADDFGGLAEMVSPDGDLRTLPCQLADLGGIDAFYAARLRRAPD